MTLNEFFAEMPGDGWEVTARGFLRRHGEHCPIIAVGQRRLPGYSVSNRAWSAVALLLHLDGMTARQLVLCADADPKMDLGLRARLLRHCGLMEVCDAGAADIV